MSKNEKDNKDNMEEVKKEIQKDMVTRDDAEVPAEMNTSAPGGMEDFGREDIIIPNRRIVQPTSAEGTAGNFRDNLTGEEFEAMNVVFLSVRNGRIMFDSDDLKAPPICGSDNRKAPAEYFETPMNGDTCNGCPQAEWTKDDKGKRVPPACNENYTMLGIDTESGMPFFFQCKGTALRPAKLFQSAVFLRAKKAGTNMWDYSVAITLKKLTNEKGVFYVPVFGIPEPVDGYAAEAEMYQDQRAGYQGDPNPDEDPENDPNDDIPFK